MSYNLCAIAYYITNNQFLYIINYDLLVDDRNFLKVSLVYLYQIGMDLSPPYRLRTRSETGETSCGIVPRLHLLILSFSCIW